MPALSGRLTRGSPLSCVVQEMPGSPQAPPRSARLLRRVGWELVLGVVAVSWLSLCLQGAPAAGKGLHKGGELDPVIPVGADAWAEPWVPDLRRPGRRIPIPDARRIDIVILGDGYLEDERDLFAADVREWHRRLLSLPPYSWFPGALRVRGLWTPSPERATPGRGSHYHLAATAHDCGGDPSPESCRTVFQALDRLGVNRSRRGRGLTHTVVVLLIRNRWGQIPPGVTRGLASPDGTEAVAAAMGIDPLHELGHALAGLRDEYILWPGTYARPGPPREPSVWRPSNRATTRHLDRLPWRHLAPGGPLNPDPASVIGVLWAGGGEELGVWHSEARCLMNGGHQNWRLDREQRGAWLRDRGQLCFWCEELVMVRLLALTGQLGEGESGEAMWRRWAQELRPRYWRTFRVAERIRQRNLENRAQRLPEARIYTRPVPR